MANIKHVFPGGNTTVGFYSFYDFILPQDEANHIFCLKGGPGVGKSSFMKKIGQRMLDLGYDVEFHHCSSDPNSLDGLVIPKLRIAFIDGTSPHIVDPKNPGGVDEIINLGEFWHLEGIKVYKNRIIQTNLEIKRLFNKAYQYLKASKEIYETYALTESKALDQIAYQNKANELLEEIFGSYPLSTKAKERHLFGYALTPEGILDYRDSIVEGYETKYVIHESPGASSEDFMNEVVKAATKRGFRVECYHSPLKVEKIEDVIIPELKLAICSDNVYHKVDFDYNYYINLVSFIDESTQEKYIDEIRDDEFTFDQLLNIALIYIEDAKKVHDQLEECYIPSMNFDAMNEYMELIIQRVLKM